MEIKCSICGATEVQARLVRDHSHWTKRIRGILCEKCNSWLGVHEHNLKRGQRGLPPRGKRQFKKWLAQYQSNIDAHLQQDTGIRYYKREPFADTIKKLAV